MKLTRGVFVKTFSVLKYLTFNQKFIINKIWSGVFITQLIIEQISHFSSLSRDIFYEFDGDGNIEIHQ
jgi:hypothetical protein